MVYTLIITEFNQHLNERSWASCVLDERCEIAFSNIGNDYFIEICNQKHCEKKSKGDSLWEGFSRYDDASGCWAIEITDNKKKKEVSHCFSGY